MVALLVLSSAACPVLAEDYSAKVDQAVNAYNEGINAEENGRYADACASYRYAADRFESAIYALVGQPMYTEEQREGIKAYANHLQENVDSAKQNAREVCGKS
ncbi:hypothetical protein ABI_46430 [Asticcacaulis biprosthecium C19]|uniref:Uncharacterized protein n=2 Tax=Asticcacaulis biprosthecium TaxID=76891 RepID=F4QTZ5_9CAUL|nr:hypothetical protein ABI_46430 [Asticcacaulis biprosthecium C19]